VFSHKGKTQSLRAWSEEVGISLGTLQSRVYHYGWTIRQALTIPPNGKNRRRMLTFNGKCKSIDAWAKELGINAATIRSRLSTYKWPICDVLMLRPREHSQRSALHLTLDDEVGTVAYWAEKTGINQATIRSRLQRFWSARKALTTPPDERFRHKGD
jgi:hypothetical protein